MTSQYVPVTLTAAGAQGNSDNQYLCGTTYMPSVPIIYSDIW